MALLFKGIPILMRVWGAKCVRHSFVLGFTTYLQAVSRDLSLSSTCLLSGFQAITISPNSHTWLKLKMRASKYVIPCCLLCWITNLLEEMVLLMYLTDPTNSSHSNSECNIRTTILYSMNHKNTIWKFVHSSIFVCLMTFFSGYMVFILFRHNQKVKHIHSRNFSPKISPEIKATQTILLLVGTFVLFNAISPFFIIYILHFQGIKLRILYDSTFLFLWYPMISPFIFINTNRQILKTFHTL
ncbi:vomeronasal type-1 receptor 1-like [Sarcophilus harrisii]|uniref:vomeronasal type-1 receptor 1-like n=1 Tax=Sarcophilus harrisii TaxID=9305 RepID=UPI0013019E02|nr:vomeronasal type-1 receptor 1-like [Sarcophilus harrisii]